MSDVKPAPKCACKSDDPYRCIALRYPQPLCDDIDPPHEIFGEPSCACDCSCHDEWHEEEDEYLSLSPSESDNPPKVVGC